MDEKDTSLSIVPAPDAALVATFTHEFNFEGEKGTYEIFSIGGKPLVEATTYNLVVAKIPSGQYGLVMIASKPDYNYLIEKQAHILATLQEVAAAENDAKIKPNYGAFFPNMIEVMSTEEDPPRVGVIMGYDSVITSYKQLVPLSVALKGQRVDLQTGLWLLGKYLKLLDFVHANGFTIGFVDDTNWLIETALHGVFVLNFFEALEKDVVDEERAKDVISAANIVWHAVGGTEGNDPPYDESIMSKEGYDEFVIVLKRMMSGDVKSAGEEMTALYEMADRIWERLPDPGGWTEDGKKRPFHEWVTYPVTE